MPFVDGVPYVPNGTGTLTDPQGDTVGYTFSGNATVQGTWNNTQSDGTNVVQDDAARVTADGSTGFEITFDQQVTGVAIRMGSSDIVEHYYFSIDGVEVDMFTLVNNGDVTITQLGDQANIVANPAGYMSADQPYTEGAVAVIQFNIPLSSVGVARGDNGNSSNWDAFEVGYDSDDFNVVCFGQGTLIDTTDGPIPVEALKLGMMVKTREGHFKEIKWLGKRALSSRQLAIWPKLRPVKIKKGALGHGLPHSDLWVSRQHRMLVTSPVVCRMFETKEVLVPAIKLVGLPGIEISDGGEGVTYHHILLDGHHVISANGAPSESFYPGDHSLRALTRAARDEIRVIFPDIEEKLWDLARQVPNGKATKTLVARHSKNQKELVA